MSINEKKFKLPHLISTYQGLKFDLKHTIMANRLLLKGRIPLSGEVEISGYKNSAGVCLAASLLSKESSIIDNLPQVSDILDLVKILEKIGAEII